MTVKTKKEESPVLFLPKDGERVTQLENKLKEYKERIANYSKRHPNQHPKFREEMLASVIAEKEILETLLGDGEVNGWAHSKAFVEEHGGDDEKKIVTYAKAWCNAWGVISDYCTTGGKNIRGGTGLK